MPIKDFEADDLTAETMRENFRLRRQNELLREECRQVAAKADVSNRPNAEMVKALLAEAEHSVEIGQQAAGAPTAVLSRKWNETVSMLVRRVRCFTNS